MEPKYYHSYEDRYRAVYRQGVKYWSAFPWEVLEDLAGLDSFLEFAGARPGAHKVLEPGCGEGHLALALVQKGFDYLGIDVAPSALEKARARLAEAGFQGEDRFVLADATDLSFLPKAGFDLAVDNRMLHMLVVDEDRRRYLAGLRRALKPGGLVVFKEIYHDQAYEGPIDSFGQYLAVFRPDLTTLEERTAYNAGGEVKVSVTRVPARPRGERGYAKEMAEMGFKTLRFKVVESYMNCVFYARSI